MPKSPRSLGGLAVRSTLTSFGDAALRSSDGIEVVVLEGILVFGIAQEFRYRVLREALAADTKCDGAKTLSSCGNWKNLRLPST